MSYSIFIVEDEIIVALEIKSSIMKLGYQFAGRAANYTDALSQIEETQPDLVLLDITLMQSKDGIAIATELNKTTHIPFIYLTSITDAKIMQQAIHTDPSGYLLKPFRREKLQSALLLAFYKYIPSDNVATNVCKVGQGFQYHTQEKLLFDVANNPIQLSPKERLLSELLIEAKGTIITFVTIEVYVWDDESISSSSLRTLIYRLHKKLGCKLIETVPTFGCKIIVFSS